MGKTKTGRQSSRQGRHLGQATATADPQQQFTDLVAAYHAGQFEEVISGASRFTRHWPEQVVGWDLLAEGYRMTGRLDDAEAACRHALRIDPQGADANPRNRPVSQEGDR